MRILVFMLLVASSYAQNDYFRKPEKIIKSTNEVGDRLGNYAFTYETEGGILQTEIGQRKYEGTENEAQLIQGSVQYNAPDGTPIALSWTADEFGTQVSGSHLPTPPPIPPEIARALEWIARQPSTEDPYYEEVTPTTSKPVQQKKQIFNKPHVNYKNQKFQ